MEEYKIKLEVETSNEYKQARTDIIKAFESLNKITNPIQRRNLFYDICKTESVKSALNMTDEQMNAFLNFLGYID